MVCPEGAVWHTPTKTLLPHSIIYLKTPVRHRRSPAASDVSHRAAESAFGFSVSELRDLYRSRSSRKTGTRCIVNDQYHIRVVEGIVARGGQLVELQLDLVRADQANVQRGIEIGTNVWSGGEGLAAYFVGNHAGIASTDAAIVVLVAG